MDPRDTITTALGGDKVYHPAQLLRGCHPVTDSSEACMTRLAEPSMLQALQRHGWPLVRDLRGKFVLSMNLFGDEVTGTGNAPCRQYYHKMGEEEVSRTLPFGGMPLFTRGDQTSAGQSNYTALMEADGAKARIIGQHGLLMRWVLLGEPDKAKLIMERFRDFPAQILNYHNAPPLP
jgi:hypothetical protein